MFGVGNWDGAPLSGKTSYGELCLSWRFGQVPLCSDSRTSVSAAFPTDPKMEQKHHFNLETGAFNLK